MQFGQRLKLSMDEKGVTNYKLAKHLECSASTVATWINGKYYPQVVQLLKICDFLEKSADWLLGIEKKENSAHPYALLLGMCERENTTPEEVFNKLQIPSDVLVDWKKGILPKDDRMIWAVANQFQENKNNWERVNPFFEESRLQTELFTHYNRLPYGSKKKFIEFLKEVESDNMDLDFMDFYEAYKKVKALQEKKTGTKKPKKVSQQK